MRKKLLKRFDQLEADRKLIQATATTRDYDYSGRIEDIERSVFVGWCVKAGNLLSTVCGIDSVHYDAFATAKEPGPYGTYLDCLKESGAILLAAKDDFDGGYLQSVRSLVQADMFDSHLEQAKSLLKGGYAEAAAVVAGVVLETTLKELCEREGITLGTMNRMNDDLAKQGVYTKLTHKQITALAGLRNAAAHGDSENFNSTEVQPMIEYLWRFTEEHIGR